MTEVPGPPPAVRTLAAIPPWAYYLAGCSAVVLLWVFVDRPVGVWMLARTDQEPWMLIRAVLRPFGAGVPQAVILILVTVWGLWMDLPKLARAGRWLLFSFIIVVLLTSAVKSSVRRPRPGSMDAPRPILAEQVNSGEWHSFPSGDVSATTTIVVVLLGLLARPQRWRWLLLVPLLVAFQRVIAARHFPADVLAGGMLGAWVGQQILRRIPPYQDWRSLPRRRAKVPVHDPT